ncbi:photosystem P840 reaction-center cytochrome c-551 [Chlorobium sp. BLA1]|uniref:photosystem P840 reaction-center cytochrome c-551 n=1 Tax=Candidatus Chlorobium masyuteum TaxID=2716876 RepID=UPI001420F1AE|nr:photosystem P840 reaction-center cytochrome c-551 [Candidatus Chlorobium masyuteum]NHQ59131.1 photosystem P840 reaction-center cytochrome c-551 [Candidatus Chlorobium masyuteum]NTU44264.1 photosystem P840 reaction-center cytochrome c-551 [Chlorobiaceae bacterium]
MDNKSNGKLAALAVGGAVLMGALLFGLSFLTGYKLPADNLSPILTPLRSFAGWFALILFASLTIMGLGKMSSRISAKWFLSFPLTIIAIVALMFASLWLRPSGILMSGTGRTTLLDGSSIRSVTELKAYLEKPVLSPNVPLAPAGFDFVAAKALWTAKCNICHSQVSTMDALKSKYKKTGKIDVVVNRMVGAAGGMITPEDATKIMQFLNEGLDKY